MARRRMLDPSFWDDESTGGLSNDARLLFICCISQADDYGKLSGSAATLKKIAFGFTDMTTADVETLLCEIASKVRGFHRYEIDGKQYIALLHWHDYQRVDHPYDSIIPDPVDVAFDPPERPRNTNSKNSSENHSESPARQLINQLSTNQLSTNESTNKLASLAKKAFGSSGRDVAALAKATILAEQYGSDVVEAALVAAVGDDDAIKTPSQWLVWAVEKRVKENKQTKGKCPPDCVEKKLGDKRYHFPREKLPELENMSQNLKADFIREFGTEVA